MLRRHYQYLLGGVPAVIGVTALLSAAWLGAQELAFQREAVHVDGRVAGIEENCRQNGGCSYHTVAQFQAERQTVRVRAQFGLPEPSHEIGARVGVLYRPGYPGDARIDHWLERWFGTLLALVFGVAFGIPGATLVLLQARRDLRRRWALRHGAVVSARVLEIRRRRFSSNLGFRIVAEWQNPRDGRVHRFTSDPVSINPGLYLNEPACVDVRLDPAAPARYWVDTRFLPEFAT